MPSVTVSLTNSVVTFTPSGMTTLPYNGVLDLNVGTGFTPGAQITSIPVFSVISRNGVDTKGPSIGTWTRGPAPTQPATGITIAVNPLNNINVTITDSDTTSTDYKYWYGVVVSTGSQTWNGDPELLVKKQAVGARAAGA
jgi:hypothetical protein